MSDPVCSNLTFGELQRLDALEPDTKRKMSAVISAMEARGFTVYVGQTLRTVAEQQAAQAAGTTSKGQNLSWHFLGRAVDFRRRLPDGTEDQTTGGPDDFWRALYEEAGNAGCRSLAYHPDGTKLLLNGTVWDAGHVENRGGYATLAEAVQAERPELLA